MSRDDGRRARAPGRGAALPLLLIRGLPWTPLRAGMITLGVAGLLAVEVTRAGLLPVAPPEPRPADPVVTIVGDVPLRLSELRVEAGAPEADIDALKASGAVARAADQLALAVQAERDGLDQALEVRAALALARRQVLAGAYLDLAVRRATDEARLRAAYEQEVAEAAARTRVSVRRAVFADEADAEGARGRIARGAAFSRTARGKRSVRIEAPTGLLPMSALPPAEQAQAMNLAAGDLSEPFETDEGWMIMRVEARRGEAVAPYAVRRDTIRARLRAEALREASRAAGLVPPPTVAATVGEADAAGGAAR